MSELEEYRENLLARFEAAAQEFRAACEAISDPLARPAAGEWSVHEIAVHTRDTDREVYGQRTRRSLEEENPLFPNFDGEAWMKNHYNAGEPLKRVLDGLVESVGGQVRMLSDLPAAAWSRPSRHETLGAGFTTQTWVERNLVHIEEHLASVRTLRGQPRQGP